MDGRYLNGFSFLIDRQAISVSMGRAEHLDATDKDTNKTRDFPPLSQRL